MKSSSTRIRCTICIPTYNQSKFLSASIDSAMAQTCRCGLLISNDGSTDATDSVLERYSKLDHVSIANHSVNLGIGRHIKWLLQKPDTDFIVRLDSDDMLAPTFVAELMKLLDLYPKAGYAHCAVTEIDDAGRTRNIRRLSRTPGFESPDLSLRRMVAGYKVAANIIMFRRQALEDAGFGSVHLNFAEDYDLCIRIADAGWGNVYSDSKLAYYRTWESPTRPTTKRKLQEILGLSRVFSDTLQVAYTRRRWNARSLLIRRVQLALGHACILDSEDLAQSDWAQLNTALQHLGGPFLPSVLLGRNLFGRSARRANNSLRNGLYVVKRYVKSLKTLGE